MIIIHEFMMNNYLASKYNITSLPSHTDETPDLIVVATKSNEIRKLVTSLLLVATHIRSEDFLVFDDGLIILNLDAFL